MDHIPRPKTSSSDPFKVPFLGGVEYDDKGFGSFPSRHGFDFEREDSDYSAEKLAPFIQSWLYFGLLIEFTQKPVDRTTFLRHEAEGGVVKEFVSLSLALNDLKPQLRPLQDEQDVFKDEEDATSDVETRVVDSEMRRIQNLLDCAEEQCINIDTNVKSTSETLSMILLSVRVLIDTLRFACAGTRTCERSWAAMDNSESLTTRLLTKRMATNGWCPSHIEYILSSFNTPLVCYISQIARRHRPEIHHHGCTKIACKAFNIDDKTYKTSHVKNNCRCKFIAIPGDEMRRIVKDGKIPLVYLRSEDDEEPSLEVKAAESSDSYIVFSHVWSDGLGNNKQNALPLCQVNRLLKYFHEYPDLASDVDAGRLLSLDMMKATFSDRPKYFWIDTLCIPVKEKEEAAATTVLDGEPNTTEPTDGDLKQMAIEKITPTFAGASRVIILDHELEQADLHDSDWCQISALVCFSAWAGRCWTFDEAALSRSCCIISKHGIFDPTALTEDRSQLLFLLSRPTLRYMLVNLGQYAWNAAASLILLLLDYEKYDRTKYAKAFERRVKRLLHAPLEAKLDETFLSHWKSQQREYMAPSQLLSHFVDCWNGLYRRQTTRSGDRHLILTNLLDLSVFQMKKFKPRLAPVVRSLPGVPLSMLYTITPIEDTKSGEAGHGTVAKEDGAKEDGAGTIEPNISIRGCSDTGGASAAKITSSANKAAKDEEMLPDPQLNRWLPPHLDTKQGRWSLPHLNPEEIWYDPIDAPFMEWTDDGWLQLKWQPDYTELVVIDPCLTNASARDDLVLEKKCKSRTNYYRVEFVRQQNDNFSKAYTGPFYLLIERLDSKQPVGSRSWRELPGACLQDAPTIEKSLVGEPQANQVFTSGASGSSRRRRRTPKVHVDVSAVYDCPIRVSILPKETKREDFVDTCVVPYKKVSKWTLKMRHNLPDSARLDARPRRNEFVFYSLVVLAMLEGPFLVLDVTSFLVLIAISTRTFFVLPLIAKIAILLTFTMRLVPIFITPLRNFWMLISLPGTLMYVVAKANLDHISTLDYFFIIPAIIGQIGSMVAILIHRYWIAPLLYEEWLNCFNQDWSAKTKSKWLDRGKWITSLFLGIIVKIAGAFSGDE